MKILVKYIFSILFLFTSVSSFSQNNFKKITIEDIWSTYTFYPNSSDEYKSMNDGENYTMLNGSEIIKYSYKTGKEISKIVNINELKSEHKPGKVDEYVFSSDETKILFTTEKERIYRHSFRATYWVCDIKSKTLTRVS